MTWPEARDPEWSSKEARGHRRYGGYHRTGVGFVVVFVLLDVVVRSLIWSSIGGWSYLLFIPMILGYWGVVLLLRTAAARVVQKPIDAGRGYSGTKT